MLSSPSVAVGPARAAREERAWPGQRAVGRGNGNRVTRRVGRLAGARFGLPVDPDRAQNSRVGLSLVCIHATSTLRTPCDVLDILQMLRCRVEDQSARGQERGKQSKGWHGRMRGARGPACRSFCACHILSVDCAALHPFPLARAQRVEATAAAVPLSSLLRPALEWPCILSSRPCRCSLLLPSRQLKRNAACLSGRRDCSRAVTCERAVRRRCSQARTNA